MNSKDFLDKLSTMSKQELVDYIQKNGKFKEPTSYDLPWTYIIPEDDENNLSKD